MGAPGIGKCPGTIEGMGDHSSLANNSIIFFFKQKTAYEIGLGIPAEPLFRSKMGKVMRHTLGASLNIRHNLSSSKGPKPLQLKLLTTYIPKTSAFTLAFSTSQRLRTTRASARTFFTFRHYITPSARNF